MVSKEQLDQALEAWEVAREKAALEQSAWATVLNSHATLIGSLRSHGHSWGQANTEFGKLSAAHNEAVLAAHQDMDLRCADYQKLAKQFKKPA